ncbi:MAG: hypothetical protein IPK75_20445 [Acidobacteria bacterium]|nr:hypothetical protein [Acidobacteriota bacterium]
MAKLTARLYDVFVEIRTARKHEDVDAGKPVLQKVSVVAHSQEQAMEGADTLLRSPGYWKLHYPNLIDQDIQIRVGGVKWCSQDDGPRVDGIHEAVLKP